MIWFDRVEQASIANKQLNFMHFKAKESLNSVKFIWTLEVLNDDTLVSESTKSIQIHSIV